MRTGNLITAIAGVVFVLGGCHVKDDIYETTHPDSGMITLTTDWTNRTSGIDVPASYTLKAGDYSATLSGTTNKIDHLFAPGDYRLYVYNTADGITVSGTTASANYTAGVTGWFFTHAMDATVAADTDHAFTAIMQQQVRQLTLEIELTGGTADRIESITGALSGVAGSYDFDSDTHGAVSSTPLTFAKDTGGKWKTTVRLLGVTGSEQRLTGTITFTNGTPANIQLDSDLTTGLAGFNTDKKTPLTLSGTIVETLADADFTATINDWTPVNGGSAIAN